MLLVSVFVIASLQPLPPAPVQKPSGIATCQSLRGCWEAQKVEDARRATIKPEWKP